MSNVLAQLAFDYELRAEKIIHMGTMCSTDPMADVAHEAFEDDWDQIWSAIGIEPPRLDAEYGEISEVIIDHQRFGFLVQIGTPVPQRFGTGQTYTCSWGHYQLKWFYGESMDEIYTKAAKWQTEYIEQKREQALSKEATSC